MLYLITTIIQVAIMSRPLTQTASDLSPCTTPPQQARGLSLFHTPPAKRPAVESHIFTHGIPAKKPFLIFGLHDKRETLLTAIRRVLITADRQGEKDYLVIDNFNNPAFALLTEEASRMQQTQELDTLLKKVPQAFQDFARSHFEKVLKLDTSSLPAEEDARRQAIIANACCMALDTAKEKGVTIYFRLDGISKTAEGLQKEHKDSYTTQELRYLVMNYTAEALPHIVFMEDNEVLNTQSILDKFKALFTQELVADETQAANTTPPTSRFGDVRGRLFDSPLVGTELQFSPGTDSEINFDTAFAALDSISPTMSEDGDSAVRKLDFS